jgi:hypothetical protein
LTTASIAAKEPQGLFVSMKSGAEGASTTTVSSPNLTQAVAVWGGFEGQRA